MSLTCNCSIEFDDEWRQLDCHWDYKRFFILTWRVTGNHQTPHFYYRIGKYPGTFDFTDGYVEINPNNENFYTSTTDTKTIYTYYLNFSNLDLDALASEGNITACMRIQKTSSSTTQTIYATLDYDLIELPPSLDKLAVTLTRKSADHIECSWVRPEDPLGENGKSVAGYCIELFCKKKDSSSFTQVSGLSLEQDDEGKYKLVEAPESPDFYTPEGAEVSYTGQATTSEAYINDPAITTFYFRPRDFEIVKDDFFMVRVYPYIVYSTYFDTSNESQQGALLSSKGNKSENDSDEMKFTLGVVRVKTTNGWVEGQVWVMTESGWKEADSIYTKTASGWKEAIS